MANNLSIPLLPLAGTRPSEKKNILLHLYFAILTFLNMVTPMFPADIPLNWRGWKWNDSHHYVLIRLILTIWPYSTKGWLREPYRLTNICPVLPSFLSGTPFVVKFSHGNVYDTELLRVRQNYNWKNLLRYLISIDKYEVLKSNYKMYVSFSYITIQIQMVEM